MTIYLIISMALMAWLLIHDCFEAEEDRLPIQGVIAVGVIWPLLALMLAVGGIVALIQQLRLK